MKSNKIKSAYLTRILALFIIVFLTLWLLPVNMVFANEGDGNTTDTIMANPTEPVTSDSTPPTDSIPPTITLIGDNTVTIEVGTAYEDAGATAADDVDGDLTESIESVSSVDTAVVGNYTVAYNVSDSSNNAAIEVIRTVNVVEVAPPDSGELTPTDPAPADSTESVTSDSTPPTITLNGDNTVTVAVGTAYEDAGATAADDVDGDLSGSIAVVNNVDTSTAGTYTVTYNVSDAAGNAAIEVVRTVEVINVSVVFNPSISTDKDDYHPGDEVTVSGRGFIPGEPLQIIFYAITSAIPEGEIEHFKVINTVGEDGTFIYKYNIIGADRYRVEARSVVTNENGATEYIEANTVEIKVEEGAIETVVLGNLFAMTTFTDTFGHFNLTLNKCGLRYNFDTADNAVFKVWKDHWIISDELIGTFTLDNAWSTSSIPDSFTINNLDDGDYKIVETLSGNTWTYTVTGLPSGFNDYDSNTTINVNNNSTDGKVNIPLNVSHHNRLSTDSEFIPEPGECDDIPEELLPGNSVFWHFRLPPISSPDANAILYAKFIINGQVVLKQASSYSNAGGGNHFYIGTVADGELIDAYVVVNSQPAGVWPCSYQVNLSHVCHIEITGTINGMKTDGTSGLSGATIGLYTSSDGGLTFAPVMDGAVPVTTTSGLSGAFSFTGLELGTYYVHETDAPYGYTADPNYYEADELTEIDPTFTFDTPADDIENTKITGTINGMKTDGTSGLSGATIGLYTSSDGGLTFAPVMDGAVPVTTTSGLSGAFSFTGLELGTYYVHETDAPYGYTADPNYYEADELTEIDPTFTFDTPADDIENTKITGTINGMKTDGTSGLSGATIGLYTSSDGGLTFAPVMDGAVPVTTTSGLSGAFSFTGLELGTYYVHETDAPYGYTADPNYYEADELTEIDPTFTFDTPADDIENTKITGTINGMKTDGTSGLSGATIGLYTSSDGGLTFAPVMDGAVPVTTTSGLSGAFSFTGLELGTYYVHETDAPYGYTADPNYYEADELTEIDPTFTFDTPADDIENTKITGTINGMKTDGTSGLSGATIGLYTSSDGGLTFAPVMDGAVPVTTTSGLSGAFSFTGLELGTYYVHETDAPYGYTADPNYYEADELTEIDPTFTFDTPADDIENTKITGTINGMKTDGTSGLSGATIGLYTSSDGGLTFAPVMDGAVPVTTTSGLSGAFSFTGLELGTYYVHETDAPYGYTADPNYYEADELTEIDPTFTFDTPADDIENTPVGKIKITKSFVSKSGVLPPSEFNFTITDEGSNITPFTIAPNTTWESDDLLLGKYIIEETDPGYMVTVKVDGVEVIANKLSPQSVEVELTSSGQLIVVEIENDPEVSSTIQLTKTGLTGTATAYFKLVDSEDNVYNPDGTINTDSGYAGEPVTSASNIVKWLNINWGTYEVVEASIPAGYSLVSITPATIVIDNSNDGGTFLVDAINTTTKTVLGTIAIQKDPAVSGVGFTLYASNGTTVLRAEKLTDIAGKVSFSSLPLGTYIVRETTGIDGYSLAPDQTVTITSANAAGIIRLTFVNIPPPPPTLTVQGITEGIQVLAFTGIDPIIPISGGSALIAGLAMLFTTLRRRGLKNLNMQKDK